MKLTMWMEGDSVAVQYPDGQLIHVPAFEPRRLVTMLRAEQPRPEARPKFEWPKDPEWEKRIRDAGEYTRRKNAEIAERAAARRDREAAKRRRLREAEALLKELDL